MSAFGPKQTCSFAPHMSAFEGKADMTFCGAPVAFLLKADIKCELALQGCRLVDCRKVMGLVYA